MNFLTSILISLVIFYSSQLVADESSIEKYRNYSPQQIAEIPEKKRSDLPGAYIVAAETGLSKGSELFFAMQLNSLMYTGFNDYNNAVKEFQKDLGEKPTGVFTVGQIRDLDYRFSFKKINRINFPSRLSIYKEDPFAVVNGVIVHEEDRIDSDVDYVQLKCNKSVKLCELSYLVLNFPNYEARLGFMVIIGATVEFEITEWNESIIYAKRKDTCSICAVDELYLDFKSEEFYRTTGKTTFRRKVDPVIDKKINGREIFKIVDGTEILDKKFSYIEEKSSSFLSSSFREKVKALGAEK